MSSKLDIYESRKIFIAFDELQFVDNYQEAIQFRRKQAHGPAIQLDRVLAKGLMTEKYWNKKNENCKKNSNTKNLNFYVAPLHNHASVATF